MSKMKFTQFYKIYGHNNSVALLSAMLDADSKFNKFFSDRLKKYLEDDRITVPDIPTESEVIKLMAKFNREVKHSSCPNNYKNRFYKLKTKLIKLWLRQGKISKITESENCYCFTIGKCSFHQPKNCYSFDSSFHIEYEEYISSENSIPFSIVDYKLFKIAAVLTLATSSSSQCKSVSEPIR